MSVTVSIKVRKELVEIAEKMVRYGIARSRSHAFTIMIERGLSEVLKEVEFWDRAYEEASKLEEKDHRLRHGGLTRLLEEDRTE